MGYDSESQESIYMTYSELTKNKKPAIQPLHLQKSLMTWKDVHSKVKKNVL
jgi:hypothetical protein